MLFSLTLSTLSAPGERRYHVGYHTLMEGRPVVAGARHKSPRGRLATSSGHTSVHRGCSWAWLVALEWHTVAAVGRSCTGRHIRAVPHRLYSHGWVPGSGPSNAVGSAVRMDLGHHSTAAGLVAAHSTAPGPRAGHSLHCCCILLGCSVQLPMDLLVQLERHSCDDLSFQ